MSVKRKSESLFFFTHRVFFDSERLRHTQNMCAHSPVVYLSCEMEQELARTKYAKYHNQANRRKKIVKVVKGIIGAGRSNYYNPTHAQSYMHPITSGTLILADPDEPLDTDDGNQRVNTHTLRSR